MAFAVYAKEICDFLYIGYVGVTYSLQGKCSGHYYHFSLMHIDFNLAKITCFAESIWSFQYGSQKVNTYFTGLAYIPPPPKK